MDVKRPMVALHWSRAQTCLMRNIYMMGLLRGIRQDMQH